jgi:SAM-dependent methyltransferase
MIDQPERAYAARQYASTDRLDARIAIHRTGWNPRPWHPWVLDHLPLAADQAVLEVGAGTGALWTAREPQHPLPRLTLTDASPAMCEALRRAHPRAEVRQCLADALPYPDGSFDGAVANHMLYHLDDPAAALRELRRVLRPAGWFAASTNSRTNLRRLDDLAASAGVPRARPPALPAFTAENGPDLIAAAFDDVRVHRYDDDLSVPDADLVVGYLATFADDLSDSERVALRAAAQRVIDAEGAFVVAKHVVLITARRPG